MNKEDTNKISLFSKIPSWVFAAIPVAATFIVWIGTTRSGFTPDDYMVINVQSPIRSFIDVISMFWRQDPNPQYWRPLADSSVSLDFWLWGWNGGMFHFTNLLFHVIAVGLVYLFVRRIFSFSPLSACFLALLFGVSGSHDSNLLWIAARADVIATIMMLIVLLSAYKAATTLERKSWWLAVSFLSYFLALSSKEVSGVIIVLLPLLIYTSSPRELWQKKWQILRKLLPYIALTVLFIIIRLQFTVPLSQMQPLSAEGSHSIFAFAKNFLYSIGYIIAPIDFRLASFIIMRYATIGYAAAVIFIIGILFLIKISGGRQILHLLYKPLLLTLVTGLVSFQSFERWRVYFPSVGVLAILVILYAIIWNKDRGWRAFRPILILLALCFGAFHIRQSRKAQSVWTRSTAQLAGYGRDIQKILALHKQRPITLEFITSPTKLGGAPLIQLSKTYLAKKAEADLVNLPSLNYGIVIIPGDSIAVETDLDLYALDPDKGFQSLVFKKIGTGEYETWGDKDEIGLFPNAEFEGGKARRDIKLLPDARYETFGTTTTIINAEASFASHVKLQVKDSSAVHLYFDGQHIVELQ
jgi:hypothetical protein